ncbi:hypothetical protein AQUCO_00600232v1 [Aquilegia coerulea]|uniref:Integrator complex subunit 7-like C-terminal domain-containing protein n=1 Tax=Aquilegia coerulea TaxID=218851 RepID=A0A2G5ENK2_AQUCA|nr:hypothetical protein AQUCO_00600232v1 [Aquilegia coerulea]
MDLLTWASVTPWDFVLAHHACHAVLWDYHKSYNKAYDDVCSAIDILAAAATTDHIFIFQRWFLNLRAKGSQIVVDILKIINSSASNVENTGNVGWVEGCTNIRFGEPTLDSHSLAPISFLLKRLAQEFDLMATSFMDMDLKSYQTCSRLPLNWGFGDSRKCSQSMLVQDLVKRLWHVDGEMSTILTQVLTIVEVPTSHFPVSPTMPLYKLGSSEKETLDVCKFALSGFLSMLEEARESKMEEEDTKSPEQDCNFYPMSCVGAKLFVFNANTMNPNRISVLPGFHLSLNLCLQLKHVPPRRVARIYCILASKPSFRTSEHGGESKGKMWQGFQSCNTNDVINLNEKLWMYMKKACDGDEMVWSCVSFVLNERGQGFSTCLLDVSAFPVGS